MFDDKVAQSEVMRYDDDDVKKTKWVKAVRNYLIGQAWEMKNLLLWAESFQRDTITFMDIQDLATRNAHMGDIGFSPERASGELWSFLNLNVTGNARTKFDAARELNGLDVWRRIVVPMAPKTIARRVAMHTLVHDPPRSKKLSELMDDVEAWEHNIEDFMALGGQDISNEEKCVIVLKMMPPDTPATLIMALEDHADFETLKAKLDKQITFLAEHRGISGGKVNLINNEQAEEVSEHPKIQEEEELVDLTHVDPASQDVILAIMRKQGFRGKVRTGPQRQGQEPRAATPPRTMTARPQKCGNCGGSTPRAIAVSHYSRLTSAHALIAAVLDTFLRTVHSQ